VAGGEGVAADSVAGLVFGLIVVVSPVLRLTTTSYTRRPHGR
jgi:hypothetical protein